MSNISYQKLIASILPQIKDQRQKKRTAATIKAATALFDLKTNFKKFAYSAFFSSALGVSSSKRGTMLKHFLGQTSTQ